MAARFPVIKISHFNFRRWTTLCALFILNFSTGCSPATSMPESNPILARDPSEFYSGNDLIAAQAVRNQNYPLLQEILRNSPEVAKTRGEKGIPLLAWAMGHDDPKAFKILLDMGAPPNDFFLVQGVRMSLISAATGARDVTFLNELLVHKADPNGLPESEPPLITAIFAHQHDRLEQLLQAGADINHQDQVGKTAIMVCVGTGDYREALKLARRGADVNRAMKNGNTVKKMIQLFPLNPNTPQGLAQAELKQLAN